MSKTLRHHLNKRIVKIDELTLPDHHYLNAQDVCYYIGEYTAGKGHAYSETNQLILNFKKTVDKRGTAQWQYKENAILQAANIFRAAIRKEAQITFVPVPPSKAKNDPQYDDRVYRLIQTTCIDRVADIRELITQLQSAEATHLTNNRPTPEELVANYRFEDSLADPPPEFIFVVDDVLTTGCHFRAIHGLLKQRYPQTQIAGLFIARRVPKSIDIDIDFD